MGSTGKKHIQTAVALIFLITLAVFSAPRREAESEQAQTHANWLPNKAANGIGFVGSQACAECHRAKAASQQKTAMAQAMASPATCDVLSDHTRLTFRNGKYSYEIVRDGSRSLYTVSDGVNKISVPIPYCFGKGLGGQTYVLQYQDKFYESRVSFFNDIKGLDLTMGHQPKPPPTLEEALGREMKGPETRQCFGCHTTNSLNGANLQLDQLREGITCEQCHGPGEKHVATMKSGDDSQLHIFNPKRLNTEEISNFCGTCHRTWEQVALMGLRGVVNVRFQPYRLTNSKCYDAEDKRISCTACHDPHEPRRRDAAFYDSKCTACHTLAAPRPAPAAQTSTASRTARPCPVAKANCTKCHMPEYEIPTSHLKFSDHHIRIVKPGDAYPN